MIYIEKLILFQSETSKADLMINNNAILDLTEYALSCEANYNADSVHMLYVTLDISLLGDLVNSIPKSGIIKTYAQNKYNYWIIVDINNDLDTVELTCKNWIDEVLRSIYIVDSKPRNLNGFDMLEWLKSNSEQYKLGKQYAIDLEVGSNLSQLMNMNVWHDNFYNVLIDMQELWGCEIKKEGFKVELVDRVGSKIPKYKIEYGKNLISNIIEEDFSSIVTGVLGKGYDKLYADNIIYSGKLKDNPNLLGQTVEMEYPIRVIEPDKEKDEGYIYYDNEIEAKKALEELASNEFLVNKIDEPLVTFDTNFLELSTVEEHKNDTKVWLDIGDVVSTLISKFNINIETRISEMTIDILSDEITKITLSNNDIKDLKPPTLNSIEQQVIKTEDKFQNTIDDTKKGLQSNIEQTAENIRLEVEDTKKELQASIDINAEEIANKVSAKDVETLVKQNAESWELSINGKLKGTNYKFDGENFSIGTTEGTDKAYHSATYSRWNHSDGSYTKVSAKGLERYEGTTGITYHHYIKEGTILLNSGESVNISAPPEILAKQGVIISTEQIVNEYTNDCIYALNSILVTPFFFEDHVQIQAIIKWNNLQTKTVEEGGFIYVHYLIVG